MKPLMGFESKKKLLRNIFKNKNIFSETVQINEVGENNILCIKKNL